MTSRRPWCWLRWVIAGVVVVIAAAVAGPFIFFHFVAGSTPAPLSLKASPTASGTQSASAVSTTGAATSLAGSGAWCSRNSRTLAGQMVLTSAPGAG